eukprot:Hpha_TRINITY_DN15562_c1_g2::TRINITY_DN15562_c1_g2_i1::g.103804::m.103804
MPLGDFGHSPNTGFGAPHTKTVDGPRRFRNRTKASSGPSDHTWRLDSPADPPQRPTGARFAARKADAGDVVARREPGANDHARPLKQCRPRPPTALVDDQKIGGHPSEGSPRRAGECFGRLGKKPHGRSSATDSSLNVHSPHKEPASADGSGVIKIPKKGKPPRVEYTCLKVGEELPVESPRANFTSKRTKSAASRATDPTFLHWPTA